MEPIPTQRLPIGMAIHTIATRSPRLRVEESAPAGDPEAELLRRMAVGDREAHRLLYERHALDVLRFLIGRLGGNRELAEEALQEVMIAAWQGAAGFRGASRVRTWLFGIAHHKAANLLRKRGRERATSEAALEAAGRANDKGEHRRRGFGEVDRGLDLAQALRYLPAEQRDALELVFYHGLSIDETSEVLGIAPGTVKSRLFRAKARLREQLAAERPRPELSRYEDSSPGHSSSGHSSPGHLGNGQPGSEQPDFEEGANHVADA